MLRLLFNIAFDAIIWLSLWTILTGHSGAEYGQNFIMFYCWTIFIFSIICVSQKDACVKEFKKARPRHKWHIAYNKYSCIVEAFAIAIVGFPITAFFYLFGGIIFSVIHVEAEKEQDEDVKQAVDCIKDAQKSKELLNKMVSKEEK